MKKGEIVPVVCPVGHPVGQERDAQGRYLKGKPGGPGRPLGALNVVTRSLREQVLDGFSKRGVSAFVEALADESPSAAAGLLARMLPSDPAPEESTGPGVTVQILTVEPGYFFMPADLVGASSFLYSTEEVSEIRAVEARARARADELRAKVLPPDGTGSGFGGP